MAKNKIKTSGKWVEIADEDVRLVWVCNNDECGGEETIVSPSWHQDNGTPICDKCDRDMEFARTEVKI